MRRKLSIIGAGLFLAACAYGGPDYREISISTGTNSTGTASNQTFSGYIDEIIVPLPAESATGTVTVAAYPPAGSSVTLATKHISATQLFRPRIDGTDTAGTDLTNDPPSRYMSIGDSFQFTVADATTGLTWRAIIKFDDGK